MSETFTLSRNSPCPCGSGKKFTNCCRDAVPDLPDAIDAGLQALREAEREETDRRARFGDVRPVISATFGGARWVAVGSRMFYSPRWRTFVDFLLEYLPAVMGVDWMKAEAARPESQRHPLLWMHWDFCEASQAAARGPEGLLGGPVAGGVAEYVNLAYDLYILEDHQALQDVVVKRMRRPDLFEGARYELFVAAACIRAGFRVEHEDESDRSRKHPEFIAVDVQSGVRLAVEGKRRHRSVERERTATRPPKADIGRLFGSAIGKRPQLPYIVFIDVNLPPMGAADGAHPAAVANEVDASVDRVAPAEAGRHPFNLLVVTNRPHRYVRPTAPDPGCWCYAKEALQPAFPAPPSLLRRIEVAVTQYGRIPDLRFEPGQGFSPRS